MIAKPLNAASPECSFSLCPYIGQQQRWSECLECVCHYKAPLSPIHTPCTPHPACCCVPDTKPNKSIAQLGRNEYLVRAASFCAWVPEPQVCPVLITVTPLPRCPPQFRWERTTDQEWISDFKHCSYKTFFPRFVSQLASKAVLSKWVALTAVWHTQGICFSSQQEEMQRVLFPAWSELVAGRGDSVAARAMLSRLRALGSREWLGGIPAHWDPQLCHFPRWKGELCTGGLLHIPGRTRETGSR